MVNITFVMYGLGGTGGDQEIYRIANRLSEDGHEVNIVTLVGWGYSGYNPVKNAKIITQPKILRPIFSIQYLLEFNKKFHKFSFLTKIPYKINLKILEYLIKKNKGDIIIATVWYTIPAVYKAGGKYCFCQDVIESWYEEDQWKGVKNAISKSFSLPMTMLSISNYTTSYLRKFSNTNKIINIGNFIADDFFNCEYLPPSSRPRVISTIARHEAHKGFDVFVKAIEEVYSRRNDFSVKILNKDDIKLNLNFPYKEVKRLRVDELKNFYASSYIIIYPSTRESFGLVGLEAMACGTPVIMTNTEGSKEYAVDGVNAIIVPINDYKAIAKNIEFLLDNPPIADKISINGLETAKQFQFKDFMRRFKEAIGLK
ncbi:glycosyltransferase [Acidianus brierleyi]|uniref:Glycosyltransferase n=2 Tax=Acidianus brierleyi TaxID=41673 RepID=A0A2U9IIN3_9CREN|nr:glycosyltransferase [Acidianus brierleyi]